MRELWHNQLSCINHEELFSFILVSQSVLSLNKKLSINKHLKQEYFSKYFATSQQPDNLFSGLLKFPQEYHKT